MPRCSPRTVLNTNYVMGNGSSTLLYNGAVCSTNVVSLQEVPFVALLQSCNTQKKFDLLCSQERAAWGASEHNTSRWPLGTLPTYGPDRAESAC